MEGTETTLESIIKENPELLTAEEKKAIRRLKVTQSVYIGNILIERIK
tara:strand:+ start:8240 stop:8383 length:144 start_codon:yes stop_codon:yes gene_type:complete